VQNVSLNVRSGPGTGYAVIGKAAAGQTLTVQGRNATGDWLQIRLPGSENVGWVSAAYVNTGEALAAVAVAEAPPATSTPVTATSAAATPAVDTQTVQASPVGGLNGKLVIQTAFGGPIYLYEFASGSLRQLTTGYDPALSPDGTQVAFTRLGGEHGLYVINVDGTGERKVFSERQGFFSPKWSPDGKWILFVRSDSFWKCKDYSERIGRYHCEPDQPGDGDLPYMIEIRPRLARVDLNGENYLDLATLDTATAPDWNSAGIVYASDGGIQRTTPDNNGPSTLVHFDVLQQYYADPDWQPGGGRIVLQHRRPSHWDLFIVNPDGSGYAPLTRPTTVLVDSLPSNVAPAWSPDGQQIVFLSNRTPENSAGAWGVWVMNADGSNQRRLPIDLSFDYGFAEEQMLDWGP
jgi:Tol biopolymer transport system component